MGPCGRALAARDGDRSTDVDVSSWPVGVKHEEVNGGAGMRLRGPWMPSLRPRYLHPGSSAAKKSATPRTCRRRGVEQRRCSRRSALSKNRQRESERHCPLVPLTETSVSESSCTGCSNTHASERICFCLNPPFHPNSSFCLGFRSIVVSISFDNRFSFKYSDILLRITLKFFIFPAKDFYSQSGGYLVYFLSMSLSILGFCL